MQLLVGILLVSLFKKEQIQKCHFRFFYCIPFRLTVKCVNAIQFK